MSQTLSTAIAVVGIDIGKNSFHIVCLDQRGAIVLRQKWSRGQVEVRFANMPPCLVGMEACVGAHHLNRKLTQLSALLITTVKGRQKRRRRQSFRAVALSASTRASRRRLP